MDDMDILMLSDRCMRNGNIEPFGCIKFGVYELGEDEVRVCVFGEIWKVLFYATIWMKYY